MKRVNRLILLMVGAVAWSVPVLAQEKADMGYTIAGIGDVNRDAVPDLAVGDPAHRQVVVFSGVDGAVLYTMEAPDPQQADFGQQFAGIEDVNGDAVPDLAVGDPTHGPVFLFSGVDGTLLSTLERSDEHAATAFGAPLPGLGQVGGDTVVEDVNGDAVADIAVEDPAHGHVFLFSGADGTLLSTLVLPRRRAEADGGHAGRQGQASIFGEPCTGYQAYIRAGDWRTLESCLNCPEIRAHFLAPRGAQIKIRKGIGWFGWDSQKQTLNGVDLKTLSMGGLIYQRMQIKVPSSTYVAYTRCVVGP
jgi:hypothetical protein